MGMADFAAVKKELEKLSVMILTTLNSEQRDEWMFVNLFNLLFTSSTATYSKIDWGSEM